VDSVVLCTIYFQIRDGANQTPIEVEGDTICLKCPVCATPEVTSFFEFLLFSESQ